MAMPRLQSEHGPSIENRTVRSHRPRSSLTPTDTTSAGHHARLLGSSDVVDAFVHERNRLGGLVADRLAMSPLSILGQPIHHIRNELPPLLTVNDLRLNRRSGQLIWTHRRPAA